MPDGWMPSGPRSRQTWAGLHAARPKVLRFDYRCSKNCVTTVRVSRLASISAQIAV
jgi:hypothetical protein